MTLKGSLGQEQPLGMEWGWGWGVEGGGGCVPDSVTKAQKRKLSQIGSKFGMQDREHAKQANNLASVERISYAMYRSISCPKNPSAGLLA